MKKTRIKVIIMLVVIFTIDFISIEAMEGGPGEFFEAVYKYLVPETEIQEKKVTFQAAVEQMNKFIRGQIVDIKGKIYPFTKTTHEGFVLTGWFDLQEAEERFEKLKQQIRSSAYETNEDELANAIEDFKKHIQELKSLQDSLAYTQSLIAEGDQELYQQIEGSFRHLDDYNIDRMKVYEALELDSKDRAAYTAEDVSAKADELNDKLEKNSKEWHQIRQVKFTIGNDVGKNLYDAWYADKEKGITKEGALSMMRIDPKDLNLMDVINLITKIKTEQADLDEFEKGLEKILKSKKTEKTLAVGF